MFYHRFLNQQYTHIHYNYKQTNLLVGIRPFLDDQQSVFKIIDTQVRRIYAYLELLIKKHPPFRTSLSPIQMHSKIPYINNMLKYSKQAGVGPMATVAGMFSDEIVKQLSPLYESVFCENGGDTAIHNAEGANVLVCDGPDGFDTKIVLELPPGKHALASSGRSGHSLSLGQADLVTVCSSNAIKSDAFATAIANKVRVGKDNNELLQQFSFLDAVLIIAHGKLWYKGKYEIDFLK